jgi:type IV pilus assembly protein PilQ
MIRKRWSNSVSWRVACVLALMLILCGAARAGDDGPIPGVGKIEGAKDSQVGRLLDLLISQQADGTQAILIGSGDIFDYKAFALPNPPRIVVDLSNVQQQLETLRIPVRSQELEKVRIWQHPNKVRLVFDLNPGLESFPPYRLTKSGGKLMLCMGEMAKKGEAAAQDLPDTVYRALSMQPIAEGSAAEQEDLIQPQADTAAPAISEQPLLGRVELAAEPQDPEATPKVDLPKPVKSQELAPAAAPVIAEESLPPDPEIAPAPAAWEGPANATESSADRWPGSAVTESPLSSKGVPYGRRPLQMSLFTEMEPESFQISTGMEPGKEYTGQRVDLDFQDIDIDNVFRILAEISDLNIIVSDKVKGKVTMRLKNVPWDQALDLILSTNNLGMVRQGNIIRVAPLPDLVREQQERRRLHEEKIQEKIEAQKRLEQAEIERQQRERALKPFVTEHIVLNYSKAPNLAGQIKDFLTSDPEINKQGKVVVDERTNTMTITDYPEKIEEIRRYITKIDKPTPQVLIEARIVKADKRFARDLGVQWGGQFAEYDAKGKWAYGVSSGLGATGQPLAGPSTWTSGSFSDGTGRDFFPESGWMVNLPATLLGAGTPGIGFQVGRLLGDLINLDLRLSAAETDGLTKTISRPKIMTLDNVEATIKQGFEIPYTQVNPEGNVSVVWKEAELMTTVTPLISPDGRVHLKLEVTDDFPDPTIVSSEGEPAIATRQATTEVLVRNGQTVVIGGILEETQSYTEQGVPWFRDVPGLSWLFENKERSNEQTELLIFVTPFLVEET